MIKSISFVALTHFFQFHQLKILRQPSYLFIQVKPTIFFYIYFFHYCSNLYISRYGNVSFVFLTFAVIGRPITTGSSDQSDQRKLMERRGLERLNPLSNSFRHCGKTFLKFFFF